MATRPHSRGFTLVEMAIVLTIIGLLVGAVIGGSKLLRQSELQTIVTNHTKYNSAYSAFKQQYGSFPGDIADANSYWGSAVNGVNVTNGNGDGNINNSTEPYQAWLHLSLAKLIEGSFSGAGTAASLGVNVPRGRINGSGWSFDNNTAKVGNAIWYNQDLGNYLSIGASVSGSITQGKLLSPSEAWQIDTKMDDGLPATGQVVALKPSGTSPIPNCTTSSTDASALYNRAVSSVECSLNMTLMSK